MRGRRTHTCKYHFCTDWHYHVHMYTIKKKKPNNNMWSARVHFFSPIFIFWFYIDKFYGKILNQPRIYFVSVFAFIACSRSFSRDIFQRGWLHIRVSILAHLQMRKIILNFAKKKQHTEIYYFVFCFLTTTTTAAVAVSEGDYYQIMFY